MTTVKKREKTVRIEGHIPESLAKWIRKVSKSHGMQSEIMTVALQAMKDGWGK